METAENTEKKSLSRREERQQALTFVFERLFRDDSAEEVFEDATEARDEEISGYARKVVTGVEEHLTEIDTLIEENLKVIVIVHKGLYDICTRGGALYGKWGL